MLHSGLQSLLLRDLTGLKRFDRILIDRIDRRTHNKKRQKKCQTDQHLIGWRGLRIQCHSGKMEHDQDTCKTCQTDQKSRCDCNCRQDQQYSERPCQCTVPITVRNCHCICYIQIFQILCGIRCARLCNVGSCFRISCQMSVHGRSFCLDAPCRKKQNYRTKNHYKPYVPFIHFYPPVSYRFYCPPHTSLLSPGSV